MIVLDTNVVSELMRATPAAAVAGWVRDHAAEGLVTTAITIAEVRYGIARLPDSARKEQLRRAADDVFAAFARQILPFDAAAAAAYGDLIAECDRAGLPITGFDAQIAAVCRSRSAALATRNGSDFRGTGVAVMDPWEPAGS